VLFDHQLYDVLGIYGRHLFLQTPNMERFAKEGVLLKNFFFILSICIYLLLAI
jgi:arylsulfatase A-like enzyme